MLHAALFLSLTLASAPLGPPPPPPDSLPPPDTDGIGVLLASGAVSLTLGIGGIASAPFLGHGGWGALSATFGVGGLIGGSVCLYYGIVRHRELRAWRQRSGMSARAWRGIHQPGRPVSSGAGLIGLGAVTLGVGLGLGTVGWVSVPPIRAYEPGDDPVSLWMAIHGTVAMASGLMMVTMGSITHRRYRRWRGSEDVLALTPYPWATPTSAGFGLTGRF